MIYMGMKIGVLYAVGHVKQYIIFFKQNMILFICNK